MEVPIETLMISQSHFDDQCMVLALGAPTLKDFPNPHSSLLCSPSLAPSQQQQQ